LQFTINEESNKQISYLDLDVSNKEGTAEMDLYRNPTARDITLNNSSCHYGEHKISILKWIKRLQKSPLNRENGNKELNTLINISEINGYDKKITTLHNHTKHKGRSDNNITDKKGHITFTGNYIRTITKLFKNRNIKISFKTTISIGNILRKTPTNVKYDHRDTYKLTCADCHRAYVKPDAP
jgi:hypothetical protein